MKGRGGHAILFTTTLGGLNQVASPTKRSIGTKGQPDFPLTEDRALCPGTPAI